MQDNTFVGYPPEVKDVFLDMQAQIASLQKQLDNTVALKDEEIAHLKEVIETYKRMLFGSKSEKTRYLSDMNQLSLFPATTDHEEIVTEEDSLIVTEHTRKTNSKQKRDDYIQLMVESGRFPIDEEVYDVPEEERFDSNGNPLECFGPKHVRYELEVTPKQYRIKDIQIKSYGSKRTDGTRAEVKAGEVPPAIIPHSPAGESVLADLVINKCDYALPIYRQERMMRDMGVPIHRNVMAKWFISVSNLVHPLWDAMRCAELQLGTIHADETFGQVLHNATGNPRAQVDYWAYCSGKWEPIQVACFEYRPTRAGKNAKRFLDGYNGKIITDGCSSYNALAHLIRGGCWSHMRRYWYNALPPELRSKRTKLDKLTDDALQIVDPEKCVQLKCLLLVNDLFLLEREYDSANLMPAERLKRRNEDCTPVLNKYWETVDALAQENTSGNLKKAVTYAMNNKDSLMKFMEHGDMPISNNAVERLIRNLVIGRKNWLFCDTEAGAQAIATLYSIIVTARFNGLDARSYFEHVLRAMANAVNGKNPLTGQALESYVEDLLPWSDQMQMDFLAPDPFECTPYTTKNKTVW